MVSNMNPMIKTYGFSRIGLSDEMGMELVERMSEPHRHYHTVAHVMNIIHLARNVALERSEMGIDLFTVAWLHDIIYDPKSSTNEEDSADYAMRVLKDSNVDRERIAKMIMDTKSHNPSFWPSMVFSDLDMAIVGAIPAIYDAYARDIRREYDFVPDAVYREKRIEILTKFDQSKIFLTTDFEPMEPYAHANIKREIAQLVG